MGSDSKESTCNAEGVGSTPGLGQSPGEENSYPLQYSGLENSMDRGAWQAIGYGVAKSWTPLRDFDTHTHTHTHTHTGFPGGSVVKNPPVNAGDGFQSLGQEDPLEKGTATHSSILVRETAWTEVVEPPSSSFTMEPGGLESKGSQKV